MTMIYCYFVTFLVLLATRSTIAADSSLATNRAWGASFCEAGPTKSSAVPAFPAGTKITVECPEGYDFVTEANDDDPMTASCRSDGSWNKLLGSCQRSGALCTRPTILSNVKVTEQSAPINESPDKFAENSFIEYQCESGYTMSGPSRITCMSTGLWSPRNPPTCSPAPVQPPVVVFTTRCNMPQIPTNGDIQSQSAALNDGTGLNFASGSYITYKCNHGYAMVGGATMTCTSNGLWSPRSPPTCSPVPVQPPVVAVTTRCYMPVIPANGDIHSQSATVNDGTGLSFASDSQITYKCKQGFVMVGGATITCNSVGNWDHRPPQCIVSGYRSLDPAATVNGLCPKPTVPPHARVVFSYPEDRPAIYPLSGRIRYTCDRPYAMNGAATIECQSNGQWSPPPPACI